MAEIVKISKWPKSKKMTKLDKISEMAQIYENVQNNNIFKWVKRALTDWIKKARMHQFQNGPK